MLQYVKKKKKTGSIEHLICRKNSVGANKKKFNSENISNINQKIFWAPPPPPPNHTSLYFRFRSGIFFLHPLNLVRRLIYKMKVGLFIFIFY